MPYFRTCSTRLSHSQAPLCHCTLRTVANRTEGTFGSLRYSFGGDHPSQTTHQALSPLTRGLDARHTKGGISTSTPYTLACTLPSLPPILHIVCPTSMLSCSEGSRGLFVPLRVSGRYTIRAGRNLPDKEFRYLRTVIVTAAVYRGFNSMLLFR